MVAAGDGHVNPDVWLRLGRWLVAGLTFQLAADMLETADHHKLERGRAARGDRGDNFFLERDLSEVPQRKEAT